jgi:hypothetical protein
VTRRQVIGLAMVGVSLVLSTWALYHLIRTGSCGSGGPYVYTRACPSGTGLRILGLMASIFLGLAGVGVSGLVGLGVLWFGMFFTLTGGAALLVGYGPASPPGSSGTGLFLGILFTGVMGLPVVVLALKLAGSESLAKRIERRGGGVDLSE